MVTHISMNSSKTVIKIYLIFNRLVGRDIVAQVEDEISRQMKPFLATKVVILEKFRLSELYTSEIIFNDYKDSIIYELGKTISYMNRFSGMPGGHLTVRTILN